MKQYGILAYPAKHSLSPVMHDAAFKAFGIDAQYGVFEIPDHELGDFFEKVKHDPISGLSVSLPYKERVLDFMNEVSDDVKKIGAANTVVNNGGFLYGHNTDFMGSNRALKEATSISGKKVVVIGAGGSARAIAYGLKQEGAYVVVINRMKEKADKLAADLCVESGEYGAEVHGDILIHTTSLWTKGGESELPFFCEESYLKNFELVMDIAYTPLITPLLAAAKKLGIKYISGEKMLLYQAAEQFKLWTELEAPVEVMKKALIDALP